jgi:SAM-dependent methyltransferase
MQTATPTEHDRPTTAAQALQTAEDVGAIGEELGTTVWAFAVVCSAAEAGLLACLGEPRRVDEAAAQTALPAPLVAQMLDVLVALRLVQRDEDQYRAAPGLLPLLQPPASAGLLADLRSTYLQAWDTIVRAKRGTLQTGWYYTDPEILAAQGAHGSGGGIELMVRLLFPQLEGLEDRLRGPWAFLDVGTGVAGIAIAMCQASPTVRVVGLEPAEAPMALARRNVAAAGLAERIQLRSQRVEELTDTEAFDLVWLPQVFLPGAVLPRALRAAWTALRPGGWILLPAISVTGADTRAALARFRNVLWGGDPLTPEEVAYLLTEARFAAARVLFGPGGTPPLVVARRPL